MLGLLRNAIIKEGVSIRKKNYNVKIKMMRYLAREGMALPEIVRRLDLSSRDMAKIKKQEPDIVDELAASKELTDYAVEDALLKRALGYVATEVKESEKPNGTEIVTTKKEVAPDVSAASAWLKIRRGNIWNEKAGEQELQKVDQILDSLAEQAEQ